MLNEYNTSRPLPSDYFRDIYSNLRFVKILFRERFRLDHSMNNENDTSIPSADGFHRQITMPAYLEYNAFNQPVYEPAVINNGVIMFCKKINNIIELCCRKIDGIFQLTENGKIKHTTTTTSQGSSGSFRRFAKNNDGSIIVAADIAGGKLFRSTDYGKTFTLVYTTSTKNHNTLIFLNNRFFLCEGVYNVNSGRVYYSADGITWGYAAFGKAIYDIAYGNGVYVCTGGSSGSGNNFLKIYKSSDGVTWTEVFSNADGTGRCVRYANGYFYSMGTNTGSLRILRSTDGAAWESQTSFAFSPNGLLDVVYFNSLTLAVINTGNGKYTTVYDLSNWSSLISKKSFSHYGKFKVIGNLLFYYSGKEIYYTSDGTTWIKVIETTEQKDYKICSIGNKYYIFTSSKLFITMDLINLQELETISYASDCEPLEVGNAIIYTDYNSNLPVIRTELYKKIG